MDASLVSLLTSICLLRSEVRTIVTPHRAQHTEGLLRSWVDWYVQSIPKAKYEDRGVHEPWVTMQEAGELVTSILNDPPSGMSEKRCLNH